MRDNGKLKGQRAGSPGRSAKRVVEHCQKQDVGGQREPCLKQTGKLSQHLARKLKKRKSKVGTEWWGVEGGKGICLDRLSRKVFEVCYRVSEVESVGNSFDFSCSFLGCEGGL